MASRIRIRAQLKGGDCEVKALMRHPMETGLRKDQLGETIPARFIETVTVTHNENIVLEAHWGAAVSANPFLGMQFEGGSVDDIVKVSWRDNQGETGEGETRIRQG